ncbi:MAG: hypothetical protein PVG87_24135 [Desulfobacteraceae bacterium]|jgi:hypothetical protein
MYTITTFIYAIGISLKDERPISIRLGVLRNNSRKKYALQSFYEIYKDESTTSCDGVSELKITFGSSKESNFASEVYDGGI